MNSLPNKNNVSSLFWNEKLHIILTKPRPTIVSLTRVRFEKQDKVVAR